MVSKFKYKERTEDDVKKRATQTGGSFDSYLQDIVQFVKVAEGENVYRILPPTWNTKIWGNNWCIDIWIHRNVGPDNGTYLCPKKMGEQLGMGEQLSKQDCDCPICEAVAGMDPEDDEKTIRDLKVKQERLAYIIDRDAPKDGVKVWRFGWNLEKKLQLRSQNKKTGRVLPIDDPDNGYDISFRREGKGLNTQYINESVEHESSPLFENEARYNKTIDFITENPLPDMLILHDAEYLDKIYRGKKGSKKDREEDEDEKEERGSRRSVRTKEDEDEKPSRRGKENTDEPEEEEEKPRSHRSSKDEEEEESESSTRRKSSSKDTAGGRTRKEPEEEEEEEPKPRGRRGRTEDDYAHGEEAEDEKPKGRGKKDQEEEEEKPKRGKKVDAEEEDKDEDEDDKPSSGKRAAGKRGGKDDDGDSDGDSDVQKVRGRLDRLKKKKGDDD